MVQSFLILIIPIFATVGAQLCLKKGVLGLGGLNFSFSNIFSLIPRIFLVLFGISFLVYLFALSKFQLNIVYPVLVSAGIVLIALASWALFKESLSLLQVLGIILIIFGIFLSVPRG